MILWGFSSLNEISDSKEVIAAGCGARQIWVLTSVTLSSYV